MPSIASPLLSSLLPLRCPPLPSLPSSFSSFSPRLSYSTPPCTAPRPSTSGFCVVVSASSFDGLSSQPTSHTDGSKKSVLLNLIQEIEPLDISLIQKDVPADTVDAMKRTISGMLGLLPSDQFHVSIESFWEPLSKLLASSMMTGYTLRNAEYRLCLEKNLDMHDGVFERQQEGANHDDCDKHLGRSGGMCISSEENYLLPECGKNEKDATCANMDFEGLRELTPEAREYILKLQSRLSSAKMELHEMKRKNAALEMQHFVGEEQNDLLDYLRSLQPEKGSHLWNLCFGHPPSLSL